MVTEAAVLVQTVERRRLAALVGKMAQTPR
jgi:hypothetical protein